jgi:CheY-like chemotaxis protein/anti-sigma regulatory factor (Ser/Thr protein kinase)
VRQIITNLLTNAHLYTDDGGDLGITVTSDNGDVAIAVSDTGKGMTPVEVEHAFDRFYRVGGGSGTGLGLAIVKSLVDLHEGTIDIESEPDVGTTFTVRLPRSTHDAEAEARREALHGKRVLIVEDEPEIAQLIQVQLEPYAVATEVVPSGEEAIERLRTESFDAVTLDVLMAGMSGFEVLQAIRSDDELRDLPVVVVSVTGGGQALAGEWVVAKPIDAEELIHALGSAVLAGRVRVLVVGREELRPDLEPTIRELGLDHEWATSGDAAERLCTEYHFDAALVDAGIPGPQRIVSSLDLRGRRLRRSVVVFSSGEGAQGIAKLDAEPLPFEDAAGEVLAALEHGGNAHG